MDYFLSHNIFITKARTVFMFLPFLFACASYNNKLVKYYDYVKRSNYNNAEKELSNNNFLNQDRNKLLKYMELGKLHHLKGSYDSSNLYFNLADAFIEDKRKSVGDAVKGTLLNPMVKSYLGEDFERFMIHYYKALNYLYLNEPDGARVEAKRITLSSNAQEDKFSPTANRYKEDAFALIMQGLIYEVNGEINNAFIAYRNATDLFMNALNKNYYGVNIPNQLVQDLLKTAYAMGFNDQVFAYEKKLAVKFNKVPEVDGGELVVFFEKGMAPVKIDKAITLSYGGGSSYFFNGPLGTMNIPFDYGAAGFSNNQSLNSFRLLRVSIPGYDPSPFKETIGKVLANGNTYYAERVQNFTVLAPEILRERMVKEISSALVRQVVKKATEYAASEAARAVAKNNSKDDKKKNDNSEAAALAAGLLVNIFNSATEKADTRNWQSLPAFIQYIRIPLKKGVNEIILQGSNGDKKITINGRGGLQLYNWCVLR